MILNQCHCVVLPQRACLTQDLLVLWVDKQETSSWKIVCPWQSSCLLVMYAIWAHALSFTLHREHTHKFHRIVNQSFLWLPLTLYFFLLVLHYSHLIKLMLSSWYATHEFIHLYTSRFHCNGQTNTHAITVNTEYTLSKILYTLYPIIYKFKKLYSYMCFLCNC